MTEYLVKVGFTICLAVGAAVIQIALKDRCAQWVTAVYLLGMALLWLLLRRTR